MTHPGYIDRCYQDIDLDKVERVDGYEVTKEDTIAFAEMWDQMDFHIDEEKAKGSAHGALIAPGTMTLAIRIKLLQSQGINRRVLASGGYDEIRFAKPLYVGDTVHLETKCVDKRLSRSKPGMGVCRLYSEMFNQNNEPVLTMFDTILVEVDPARPAE
jgi:acyl dehydratase